MKTFYIRQSVMEYYAIEAETLEEAEEKLFDDEVKPYEIDYRDIYLDREEEK